MAVKSHAWFQPRQLLVVFALLCSIQAFAVDTDGTIDVLTRVNNSTTYVSPITNGTVGGNYFLYNFTTDQVIGR